MRNFALACLRGWEFVLSRECKCQLILCVETFFDHLGFIALDSRVFSHIDRVITGQKEVRNTKKTFSKSYGEDVSYAANLEGRNGDTHPDGVLRHKDILGCSWVTNRICNLPPESDWILLPLMRVEFPTWLRVSIKCAESYFESMVYILHQTLLTPPVSKY